jgi:hypothetical protein
MKKILVASACIATLSGCVLEEDKNSPESFEPLADQIAVISTPASDYSSGAHAVIDTLDYSKLQTELLPTVSDMTVASYGEHFYRIERSGADNIAKFHISEPSVPVWQFTTLDADEEGSGNPHDIVFVGEDRAFIPRYGKHSAWIVNPSATVESEFKVGELNLSAYAVDSIGGESPNATSGIVIGDKLFIVMQRLDAGWFPQQAYVAVFDVNTMTEVDTGFSGDSVKGIPLIIKNPAKISYSSETGLIYVQGLNHKRDASEEYLLDSGIETINPTTYAHNLLVDDKAIADGGVGRINSFTVVTSNKGYLVSSEGWKDNTVYSFNPTTGEVNTTAIDGSLDSVAIGDIATDREGKVWISNRTSIGMTVIDSVDDSIVDSLISTQLSPQRIVFVDKPEEPEEEAPVEE